MPTDYVVCMCSACNGKMFHIPPPSRRWFWIVGSRSANKKTSAKLARFSMRKLTRLARAHAGLTRAVLRLATVWKTPVMWVQTHQNQKQKQAVGQRSVVFLWPFVWKKTHFTHIKVSTQTYCSCCSLLLLRRTLKTKKDGEITCAASERIQSATDAIGP